jgi:hypothetical protein
LCRWRSRRLSLRGERASTMVSLWQRSSDDFPIIALLTGYYFESSALVLAANVLTVIATATL